MQEGWVIRGRVLYVTGKNVYLARGGRLLKSFDGGNTWQSWASLPVSFRHSALMRLRLPARLLRLGVHHLGVFDDLAVVIANRETFAIDGSGVKSLGPLRGSRPMALCVSEGGIVYYGEYSSNSDRKPVHVWALNKNKQKWHSIWCFKNIRHIHGLFHDPYTGSIWVTTGDLDHEAGIWRTDDHFATLRQVAGGSQQLRAVQLLFTRDHVYFGSDAPHEQNHIYRMNREGGDVEKLASVGSSVFYGCKVGEHLFFLTAVEPSKVNQTRHAEIWGSLDEDNWQVADRFKKDIWPMKYFQYGQVLFPAGPGDGENLWFTPMATRHDQKSFSIPIKTIIA